jgi:hypothetical protein
MTELVRQHKVTRRGEMVQPIMIRTDDPIKAVADLGLRSEVIQKFGDQITPDLFYAAARRAVLGRNVFEMIDIRQDVPEIREATLSVVNTWLREAPVRHFSMMENADPVIKRFARRMYLEFNPDNMNEDQLAKTKKEWGL